MKKFEEEIKGKVETMATQPGCSMTRKVWYKADDIHEFSNDWISPEDHQAEIAKIELQNLKYREEIARMQKSLRKKNKAIKELNGAVKKSKARLKECEDLRIEANNSAAMEYSRKCEVVEERAEFKREIEKLKSQLEKQQPEIPEFVAEDIKRLHSYVKSGKNHHIFDISYYTDKSINWIEYDYENYQKFYLAVSTGNFTVAKEKRFYLKNKFTGNYLSSVPEANDFYHISLRDPNSRGLVRSFTQKEIASMETGSYEQIEVEE